MKEIERKSHWHDIIGEPRLSHQPEPQMPGNLPSTPVVPPAHIPMPPTTSDSKDDVEWLCHEGGADLAAFLTSKAIPIQAISAETTVSLFTNEHTGTFLSYLLRHKRNGRPHVEASLIYSASTKSMNW